jgi:hypothetical protein
MNTIIWDEAYAELGSARQTTGRRFPQPECAEPEHPGLAEIDAGDYGTAVRPAGFGRTAPIPREDAWLVALPLRACPNHDLYFDGRLTRPENYTEG